MVSTTPRVVSGESIKFPVLGNVTPLLQLERALDHVRNMWVKLYQTVGKNVCAARTHPSTPWLALAVQLDSPRLHSRVGDQEAKPSANRGVPFRLSSEQESIGLISRVDAH
jgi:hypothetical protein